MKEITVISGKGGTGKTTFTANLASLLDNLVIGDCDVDAPNLHLLLNPENKSQAVFKGMKMAVKNNDLCIDCGLCYENCRFNAITSDNYQIENLKCEGCAVCAYVCPTEAIKMEEIETGILFEAESRFGEMIHAKLIPGADTSGKLVSEVKTKTAELAKEKNKDWILIDGSPGIGCPVIASLSGSDLAVLVTEPTLSAFSDLKRVLEVVNHFKMPAGIVINKYDINENISAKIEAYAKKEEISLLTKIPYSRVIVDSLKKGELFVDNDLELKNKLLNAKNKIKKILGVVKMKKIAVPVKNNQVSAHFGHAPEFKLYSIEAEQIKKEEIIKNPGHKPGLLPKLLSEAGADAIIASGMGQKAIKIFEENNIKVICGANGDADKAVKKYLAGDLDLSDNACSHDDQGHNH